MEDLYKKLKEVYSKKKSAANADEKKLANTIYDIVLKSSNDSIICYKNAFVICVNVLKYSDFKLIGNELVDIYNVREEFDKLTNNKVNLVSSADDIYKGTIKLSLYGGK